MPKLNIRPIKITTLSGGADVTGWRMSSGGPWGTGNEPKSGWDFRLKRTGKQFKSGFCFFQSPTLVNLPILSSKEVFFF